MISTREHIIPQLLLGCDIIHDVCKYCNSKLGREVDVLALEDWKVGDAIRDLCAREEYRNHKNLQRLQARLKDRGRTEVRDADSGTPLNASTLNGETKVQFTEGEGGISYASDPMDLVEAHRKRERRKGPPDIPASLVNMSKSEILQGFESLGEQDLFTVPISDSKALSIGKTSIEARIEWKETDFAASRLVAKIVYEMVMCRFRHFLPGDVFDDPKDLDWLRLHALHGGPANTDLIYRFKFDVDEENSQRPEPEHAVWMMIFGEYVEVIVSLFWSVNFRVRLPHSAASGSFVRFNDRSILGAGMMMTCAAEGSGRYLGLLDADNCKWEWVGGSIVTRGSAGADCARPR